MSEKTRSKKGGDKALTANRLTDGVVIFLAADGAWVEDAREARVEGEEAGHAALEAAGAEAEAAGIAVGPYLIDVARDADGAVHPTRNREVIRARGPSTHPHHGKQAEGLSSREAA